MQRSSGVLIQIRRALRPDGLFLGVLPASGTLQELRHCLLQTESSMRSIVHMRVDPFMSVNQAGNLLQYAGFSLPVTDVMNGS